MNQKNKNEADLVSRRKVFSLAISKASKIFSLPRNLLDEISKGEKIVVEKASGAISRDKSVKGGEE